MNFARELLRVCCIVQQYEHLTWFYRPHKVFLRILYLRGVLIKNPDDASLAPLGILHNMQIRAAITEISLFGHNSLI